MKRENPYTRAGIDRLIAEMNEDGIRLSGTAVLRAVSDPHWESVRGGHDWRAYIPPSVRRCWADLPVATRLRVFEVAELVALAEDSGATMVTGPARH